ncbi:ExbD/TolR family protein [Bryobacter aggregatus]|uniref:ExbD/TolR family protein n=1 Tax=Bryobacter aggregatus TaxID=360054 RepID=UPI0004E168B9|nr:biopolymer transporter ExbD [Bryobacter aggregatus]
MAMQATSTAQGQINMTPMIDVLLVLIIIFMVISPATPRGYPAELPQDAPPPAATVPDSAVVLEIAANGDYLLNHTVVAFDSLESRLSGIFNARAEKVLFLKGSGELEYQAIVPAIAASRTAGIDRIGLLTK